MTQVFAQQRNAAPVLALMGTAPALVAPAITSQPAPTGVTAPDAATFTVSATGSGPLAYQWRRNGLAIAGAVLPQYTTGPTTALGDNGAVFSVVVSNAVGSITSNNAALTVLAAAATPPPPAPAPSPVGFSVTATPPAAGLNVFLLISPATTYPSAILQLPQGEDGQELLVHCRQPVTTLTVQAMAGQAVSGAPTSFTAAGFFRLRFDALYQLWCRIG